MPKQLNRNSGEIEKWLKTGQRINEVISKKNWELGDWWLRGDRFGGETRKQIVESSDWNGPSFNAMMNIGSTAKKFPKDDRWDALTFTHHQRAKALEKAEYTAILDRCVRYQLSVSKLDDILKLYANVIDKQAALDAIQDSTVHHTELMQLLKSLVPTDQAEEEDEDTPSLSEQASVDGPPKPMKLDDSIRGWRGYCNGIEFAVILLNNEAKDQIQEGDLVELFEFMTKTEIEDALIGG